MTGQEPSVDMTTEREQRLCAYLDTIYLKVWHAFPWPWTVVEEKRYFREFWYAHEIYKYGDEVYHSLSDKYYRSTIGNNTDDPSLAASASHWTDITGSADFERYVPTSADTRKLLRPEYSDTTTYEIGSEIGVQEYWEYYRSKVDANLGNDPILDDGTNWRDITHEVAQGSAPSVIGKMLRVSCIPTSSLRSQDIQFNIRDYGYLVDTTANYVYVQYQKPAPRFNGIRFSIAEQVPAGSVRLNPEDGDCYKAIQRANNIPISDTNYWEKQVIYYDFKAFLQHELFAMLATTNSQDVTAQQQTLKAQEEMSLMIRRYGNNQAEYGGRIRRRNIY